MQAYTNGLIQQLGAHFCMRKQAGFGGLSKILAKLKLAGRNFNRGWQYSRSPAMKALGPDTFIATPRGLVRANKYADTVKNSFAGRTGQLLGDVYGSKGGQMAMRGLAWGVPAAVAGYAIPKWLKPHSDKVRDTIIDTDKRNSTTPYKA